MHDRAFGMLIEAFNIDPPPVAGRHQHRDTPVTGRQPQGDLHVERIAFFDGDVQPIQERIDGVCGDSGVEHIHRQVGSSSAILRAAT